jgi:hypothetical protein
VLGLAVDPGSAASGGGVWRRAVAGEPGPTPGAAVLAQAPAGEEEPPAPQPPIPLEPERPRAEKPLESLLLEAGAVLLRRGTLQVEPSIDYTHFSTDRVAISGFTIFEAIVIGTIRVDKIDRDIVTAALTTRYGLLDRLQLEAKIPFLYRRDRETLGVETPRVDERTIEAVGLGDVEASVLWQALLGRDAVPGVVLKILGRFPTGTDPFEIETEAIGPGGERRLKEPPTGSGFYSIVPGFTLVWRTDPIVFFGGANYWFNPERDVGADFGRIDPGDAVQFFAGLNFAVSERVAVNASFVDQITGSTTQEGRTVRGTSFNDGRVILGASVALSPETTILATVAIGLTEASPDFGFTLSLPITLRLFE